MSYSIDPNAPQTATMQQFAALVTMERQAVTRLGQILDDAYRAIWAPKTPATVESMVAACGTNFLARLQTHQTLAAIVLAMEAANGMDSARHPWAQKQENGSYAPGTPPQWTITWTLDANQQPTGAATASLARS